VKTDYLNGLTELEITTLAKNGDKNATELLWKTYRKPMMNVFYPLHMSCEERESEAADVFMHYLKNLFDPGKAENQVKDWTFFSYLYSGMISRRSKLRKMRVYITYDESVEPEDESGALNAEKLCLSNKDLFVRYNPEHNVVSKLDFKIKLDQLYGCITPFQKTILELAMKELTEKKIANKLGYTPFKIWCNCRIIEKYAKEIFEA
jgi:hypothetical protein